MLGQCFTLVLLCTLGALTVRGDNSEIVTANAYIQGLKEVAGVLVFAGNNDRTLIKEIFTDSTLTKFRKVGNFFNQLGGGFSALTMFTNLIFGSIEAGRHKQVLKEFEKVNNKLDKLGYEIKASTERIVDQIWTSHVLTWVADLETATSIWNNYQKTEATEYKEQIIKLYSDNKIKTAVIGLKNSVGKNARSIGKSSGGDCKKILLFKAYITSVLIKPYQVFKAGCVWNSIKTFDKSWYDFWSTPESSAKSTCTVDNLPDLQSEIYKPIDDEVKECTSKSSVKTNLEAWIDNTNNVHSGQSIFETSKAIEGVMKDRFAWMDFMLLVYEPVTGEDKHWVASNLHKFRFRGRNIAITFKSSECTNWPDCKKTEASCPGEIDVFKDSTPNYRKRNKSSKDVYIELNHNWKDLKSVPLTAMIIKNKKETIGSLVVQFRWPNYVLGYDDNKYTVCHLKANANMGHNNIFQAFLFF